MGDDAFEVVVLFGDLQESSEW